MDNEKLAGQEVAAEFDDADEPEYELSDMETEDLDDAMREALEAVERGQEHLAEARAESANRDGGTPAAEVDGDLGELQGDLGELQTELAELRDRSVRTLADFDNYRKRVARERVEERRYAVTDLAQDILAVVDNLERALDSEGSTEDLKQGVAMIHRQLQATLRRHGIHQVAAQGEPFDPSLHEAVMRVEDAEVSEPLVQEELQSGYTLHDRLLRPSMVKVAVPAAAPNGAEPEAD